MRKKGSSAAVAQYQKQQQEVNVVAPILLVLVLVLVVGPVLCMTSISTSSTSSTGRLLKSKSIVSIATDDHIPPPTITLKPYTPTAHTPKPQTTLSPYSLGPQLIQRVGEQDKQDQCEQQHSQHLGISAKPKALNTQT